MEQAGAGPVRDEVGLRCTTPQASDTILGQGWASLGYSASTIEGGDRGIGFLLNEGDSPVRLKACHLTDEDLRTLANRAEALRSTGLDELERRREAEIAKTFASLDQEAPFPTGRNSRNSRNTHPQHTHF